MSPRPASFRMASRGLARLALCVAASAVACAHALPLSEPLPGPPTLTVSSASLDAAGRLGPAQVAAGMGCTGGNQSPHLAWRGAPEGTQSFAVVVFDVDAPTGVGFFHWTVANIPADVDHLAAGALPASAVAGHSDVGTSGYVGACPPPGPAHRYVASVYALDVAELAPGPTFTGAMLRFLMRGHVLAHGHVVGTYARPS